MHRQLADIAARGEEPVAALWASETPIYGRYGYGRACSTAYFEFERGDGALAATAPVGPAADAAARRAGRRRRPSSPRSTTRCRRRSPGSSPATDDWWGRVLYDDRRTSGTAAAPLRCLLAEDGAGVRGYALYASRERWDEPDGPARRPADRRASSSPPTRPRAPRCGTTC